MAGESKETPESTETSMEPTFTYECVECGARTEAAHRPPMCDACGGELQNISITREQ